jgi:hypothetical protein
MDLNHGILDNEGLTFLKSINLNTQNILNMLKSMHALNKNELDRKLRNETAFADKSAPPPVADKNNVDINDLAKLMSQNNQPQQMPAQPQQEPGQQSNLVSDILDLIPGKTKTKLLAKRTAVYLEGQSVNCLVKRQCVLLNIQ